MPTGRSSRWRNVWSVVCRGRADNIAAVEPDGGSALRASEIASLMRLQVLLFAAMEHPEWARWWYESMRRTMVDQGIEVIKREAREVVDLLPAVDEPLDENGE